MEATQTRKEMARLFLLKFITTLLLSVLNEPSIKWLPWELNNKASASYCAKWLPWQFHCISEEKLKGEVSKGTSNNIS